MKTTIYEIVQDKTWAVDSTFDNLNDAKNRKSQMTSDWFIRRTISNGIKVLAKVRLGIL